LKAHVTILTFLVLSSLVSHAGSFILSGVVPDKGCRIFEDAKKKHQYLEPDEQSKLNVFVTLKNKNSRSPQSVDGDSNSNSASYQQNSEDKGWKKLTKKLALTELAYVKVQAP